MQNPLSGAAAASGGAPAGCSGKSSSKGVVETGDKAVVVIAVIPAVLVCPFVRKHFTEGVITGAVKG